MLERNLCVIYLKKTLLRYLKNSLFPLGLPLLVLKPITITYISVST